MVEAFLTSRETLNLYESSKKSQVLELRLTLGDATRVWQGVSHVFLRIYVYCSRSRDLLL
jgi:hypothetical protein